VSADTDFGGLIAFSAESRPSLILLRGRPKRPTAQADRILSNLSSFSDALENGAVAVIEETRIRVRRLPFGSREGTQQRGTGWPETPAYFPW
jgi:hypothetical protein